MNFCRLLVINLLVFAKVLKLKVLKKWPNFGEIILFLVYLFECWMINSFFFLISFLYFCPPQKRPTIFSLSILVSAMTKNVALV